MPLLAAANLTLAYGEKIILDGCSISIEPGERVGLVGRNGTGKSSLMKVLAGLIRPDSGDLNLQKGRTAGYLHQDPELDATETLRGAAEGAFENLHNLHKQLDALFEKMASADGAELEKLLRRQATLEREMEAAGGYTIDHRIDAVLHGLGFTDDQFSIKVSGLSGGQKSRLALSRLLLTQPDILLLDEPTNHLDIDGRIWLEDFLKNEYRGAVMLISHDRYLLDQLVTRIIEIEDARLIDYPGNYETFRTLRTDRRMAQLRAWENQQTKFRQEEAFIRRYKAGQRAKQAKGRETKLERARKENLLERPMEMSQVRFQFPKAPRSGDIVASARGLSKSYTNKDGSKRVLFDGFDVSIERGERWGIIGPNGAGKTTFVRCLLGELAPDRGTTRIGTNVVVGYFSQTQEHLKSQETVCRYLQGVILREAPTQALSEQQARDLAGAFLFSGSDQEKELGMLSGGERVRAVLAGLLASAKNLLVLDEPTNHLDIISAERLEDALQYDAEEKSGFDGTLILISHDRALIDATCDHLIVLDGDGGAEIFIGNYTDWHEREIARRQQREQEDADRKRNLELEDKKRKTEDESRRTVPAPKPIAPPVDSNPLARLKTEQIEKRIEQIEKRVREIDASLNDSDVWKNHARCTALGEEREKLVRELEPLEFEWARRAETA